MKNLIFLILVSFIIPKQIHSQAVELVNHELVLQSEPNESKIKLKSQGVDNGGTIYQYDSDGTLTLDLSGDHGSNRGSYINMFRGDGAHSIQLDADQFGGGQFYLKNSNGDAAVHMKAHGSVGSGATMELRDVNGANRIFLDTDAGTLGSTALLNLFQSNGINAASIISNLSVGSQITLRDPSGNSRVTFTANPPIGGYHVAVDGNIISEEVRVELSQNWPDYVFEPEYHLTPLVELEKKIRDLGHLPGIPPAKTVENEGIDLGDMQTRLLKKIEELTLYMIEANKEIAKLKHVISK